MNTIKIKTHNVKAAHNANHFFILSKGYNSGMPMENPCPNCFIVTADNPQQKRQLFWICYSLWKSGIYQPLFCGSVIPFLHLNDIAGEIEKALQKAKLNPVEFDAAASKLQQLMHTEKLLEYQLKLIAQYKISIARKLAL